jgi:hypothetical protein
MNYSRPNERRTRFAQPMNLLLPSLQDGHDILAQIASDVG